MTADEQRPHFSTLCHAVQSMSIKHRTLAKGGRWLFVWVGLDDEMFSRSCRMASGVSVQLADMMRDRRRSSGHGLTGMPKADFKTDNSGPNLEEALRPSSAFFSVCIAFL
jgi:hypothetical protein